ncbi:ABC transporter substrate-binding protein [Vibrio cholerae]
MPRTVLIKLNNEHPLLNHADVRQAISLAINREGIAQSVLKLPGSEAHQLFSPALGAWRLSRQNTAAASFSDRANPASQSRLDAQ